MTDLIEAKTESRELKTFKTVITRVCVYLEGRKG